MDIEPELNFVIKQEIDINDIEYNINNNYHPDFNVDVKIESEDNEEDWCIKTGEETHCEQEGKDIEEKQLDVCKPCSGVDISTVGTTNMPNEQSSNGINSGLNAKKKNTNERNQADGNGNDVIENTISKEDGNSCQYLLDSDSKDEVIVVHELPNREGKIVECQNIELAYQCKDCSITFDNDENLLEHIRAIHGSNVKDTKRQYIFEKSPTMINLYTDNDVESSTQVDEDRKQVIGKKYKCAGCKEMFAFMIESTNNDNKCYKCKQTQADVPDDSSDSGGLIILHNKPKKKQMHTCKICNKTFKYKHWHAHMRQVHGPGSYACEPCKMEFKCARYLKRHMMYQHEGVLRSFERNKPENGKVMCPHCPKTFKNSDNLTHHIQNCHGEPVQCDICGCTVKSKSYLQSHKRRKHRNDKKFSCPTCSKQLKSQEQVQVHIKKCHSIKKETCKYCGKEFNCKQYHRAHLKRCPLNLDRNSQTGKRNEDFINVGT